MKLKGKQILSGLLVTALCLGSSASVFAAGQEGAYWPTFRKDNSNMAIVDTTLPITNEPLKEKWNQSFYKPGVQGTVSEPIVLGENLYVVAGKNINRMDKATGEILNQGTLVSSVGFFSRATYGDGKIFVPVNAGIIQAFDATTLESLWCTERVKNAQTLCQVTYDNGYLYTGYWQGGSNTGKFFAVDTNAQTVTSTDPKLDQPIMPKKWESADNGGFYWSGATVTGNIVVFGGDSGTLYAVNRETGEAIDTYQTKGKIRSCITQSAEGNFYFTAGEGDFEGASNDGFIYKVGMDESGHFTEPAEAMLEMPSTCNPMVYNGRVYVPMGKTFNATDLSDVSIFNATDLSKLYDVEMPGCSKSSPLLTTAYATPENNQTVYLYLTLNNEKGQIVRIEDNETNTTPKMQIVYTPELPDKSPNNNCTGSLVSDAEGTLYYHNDNGHLIALTGTSVSMMMGDVDEDKEITSFDALMTLQASVEKIELLGDQIAIADVDGDKEITSFDALLILQYSVGKITEFPSKGGQ
ncbi:MAG: PQQ-binding-like beta-propeller repeat protein [Eubacterium sp.]